MKFTFTPDHIAIADLFGSNVSYIVPEYQRPYSWDCIGKSEKNNQLNVMWDDIIDFFDSDKTGEYFFGSMVMIEKQSRNYEVIDGQQRLTSLVILFVAIKCFLKNIENKQIGLTGTKKEIEELETFLPKAVETINDVIFNKKTLGLTAEKKVKIEKNAEFDYDKILTDVMDCIELQIPDNANKEQKKVSKRYYANRDYFIKKIETGFLDNGKFSKENAISLDKFTEFLKYRLSVVRIIAPDFDVAYQIFEILNNRGLPLSNKDLFRNFIIQQFTKLKISQPDKYNDINPSEKWNYLENNYTLTQDFIGRWVESKKAGQQKYSAFNDLKELFEKKYTDDVDKSKVEKLFDDVEKDLEYYSLIVDEAISDIKIKNKIIFLLNAGNVRYTINLLIALFRSYQYNGYENSDLLEFISCYERYFIFVLLSKNKRFTSSSIYNAIEALNNNNIAKAKEEFIITEEEKDELRQLINDDFKDNTTAKLFISKYIWHKDSNTDDVVSQKLDFNKSTLEHIMPQNPAQNTNWLNDFSDDFRKNYTYKLGNMTLLTRRLNSSAKNSSFNVKKEKYKDTILWVTQNLTVDSLLVNEEFFINRQKEIIKSIYADLQIQIEE